MNRATIPTILRTVCAQLADTLSLLQQPCIPDDMFEDADRLAQREAETEVTEPQRDSFSLNEIGELNARLWADRVQRYTYTPSTGTDSDRLDRIAVLLEDIRDILQQHNNPRSP